MKQMKEVRRRPTEIEAEVPTLREQLQVSKVRLKMSRNAGGGGGADEEAVMVVIVVVVIVAVLVVARLFCLWDSLSRTQTLTHASPTPPPPTTPPPLLLIPSM